MNPKNLKKNYRHKTKTSIHHWSLQATKRSSEREEKKHPKTQNQKPKKKKKKKKKKKPKMKKNELHQQPTNNQPASQPAKTRAARGFKNQRNPQMWERLIDRCRPNTQKLYFRRNKPTRIQKYPTPRQKKARTGDDERGRGEIERERRRRKEAREPACLRGGRAGGAARAVLRSLFDSLWRPGDKPAGRQGWSQKKRKRKRR
jgi:hypothetical protein